ncbi:MAG: type II secretion system protein [Nitrospirae bacterium]|uniref:pilus assembly FimT family protein n=1 Tax=Candidatus Magnetobacterium casense TaxID=1455061 RepID=UPI0005906FFB|nr:type II secretion system protein [Candidatus Magnetobacterium casensis]MBF0337707.1 type II secretion system protein [Nitrospirota bacterium]
MRTERGYTGIEVSAIVAILGIIVGVFVYNVVQFIGSQARVNIATNMKQLYADLSEMRVRAMAENRTYGIFINNTPPAQRFALTTYELRCDGTGTTSAGKCDTTSATDGRITDPGGFFSMHTIHLQGQTYPITLLYALQVIAFTPQSTAITELNETVTSAFAHGEMQLYTGCRECDKKTTGCKPDNPATTCRAAATPTACNPTSPGCDDVNYPEFSCITISETTIKLGKWCDLNCNGVYDTNECVKK